MKSSRIREQADRKCWSCFIRLVVPAQTLTRLEVQIPWEVVMVKMRQGLEGKASTFLHFYISKSSATICFKWINSLPFFVPILHCGWAVGTAATSPKHYHHPCFVSNSLQYIIYLIDLPCLFFFTCCVTWILTKTRNCRITPVNISYSMLHSSYHTLFHCRAQDNYIGLDLIKPEAKKKCLRFHFTYMGAITNHHSTINHGPMQTSSYCLPCKHQQHKDSIYLHYEDGIRILCCWPFINDMMASLNKARENWYLSDVGAFWGVKLKVGKSVFKSTLTETERQRQMWEKERRMIFIVKL